MAGQAKQLGCAGLDDLLKLLEENKDASDIYILFCGETNETGESWCPDCVKGIFHKLKLEEWCEPISRSKLLMQLVALYYDCMCTAFFGFAYARDIFNLNFESFFLQLLIWKFQYVIEKLKSLVGSTQLFIIRTVWDKLHQTGASCKQKIWPAKMLLFAETMLSVHRLFTIEDDAPWWSFPCKYFTSRIIVFSTVLSIRCILYEGKPLSQFF